MSDVLPSILPTPVVEKKNPIAPIEVVTATDAVYNTLRQHILSGQFAPGQRLDMSELERQLGVSRSPIKDAINRLANEGIVEVQSRRGTFVTAMSQQRLQENFEVRAILSVGCCRGVVERISDEEIRHVQSLMDHMQTLIDRPDWQSQLPVYLTIDRQFHHSIVSAARNERLIELYEQNTIHLVIARIRTFYTRDEVMESHEDHIKIAAALEARNAELLAHHTDAHIRRAQAAALRNLQREREWMLHHPGSAGRGPGEGTRP